MHRHTSHKSIFTSARSGFTIVELTVVIVVIAILAIIVVVAYGTVEERAIESSMQSDIEAASAQIQSDKLKNGSYPANAAAADNGQGLQVSQGNVFTYVLKPYGYCLMITNPGLDTTFRIKSVDGKIAPGDCDVVTSTYAGSGTQGTDDGPASTARFYRPRGVAVDTQGNVYVSDSYNHRIRKITPEGEVSTLAGSTSGSAEGTGTGAQFASPNGIAVDPSGNVYVADTANHKIRKITPEGETSTVAGTGVSGYVNGATGTAQFASPYGITLDPKNGDIYVADTINYRIRKISGGVVSTFTGAGSTGYVNGASTVARFAGVSSLAFSNGVLYLADSGNHRIRAVASDGSITTFAGSGTGGNVDGVGVAAQFNNPTGIAADAAGTLYVANNNSHRIRAIAKDGTVTTIAGSSYGFANGIGTASQFYGPYGVAVDASGAVYVGDYSNHRVRKILP